VENILNEYSIKKGISSFLFGVMKELGLTQEGLADLLGINQGSLSKYLNEKEIPKIDFLVKLSNITNYKLEDILNSEGKEIKIQTGGITVSGNNNITANGSVNLYPKISIRKEYVSQPDDISSAQASRLKELVDQLVELEKKAKQKPKSHQAIWTALNRHMKVTYYREIKATEYFNAETYLMKWKGRLQGQRNYIKNEPDEWRKSRYTAIYARAKLQLNMSREDVHNYIRGEFSVESLKDLSNDDLDRLYKRFMAKK
jgi:transcriptional regulator with XRE-family HTH domain